MKWRDCRLGDVLTLKRGHDLPSDSRHDGDVPVVSSSGITGYHSEAKATAPGVITGRYGTIGEVFYLEQAFWPLNSIRPPNYPTRKNTGMSRWQTCLRIQW